MKKRILFLALVFFLTFTSTTLASTFYNAGGSSPPTVSVYGTNVWSHVGTWDLTDDSNIPDGATIDIISVAYDICTTFLGCGMNYNDTNVALFNSDGNGYYVNSFIYISNFRGEPAKQVWTTQFWVSNRLVGSYGYIRPILRLYWNDPVTGATGIATLNAEGNTNSIEPTVVHDAKVARISDAAKSID